MTSITLIKKTYQGNPLIALDIAVKIFVIARTIAFNLCFHIYIPYMKKRSDRMTDGSVNTGLSHGPRNFSWRPRHSTAASTRQHYNSTDDTMTLRSSYAFSHAGRWGTMRTDDGSEYRSAPTVVSYQSSYQAHDFVPRRIDFAGHDGNESPHRDSTTQILQQPPGGLVHRVYSAEEDAAKADGASSGGISMQPAITGGHEISNATSSFGRRSKSMSDDEEPYMSRQSQSSPRHGTTSAPRSTRNCKLSSRSQAGDRRAQLMDMTAEELRELLDERNVSHEGFDTKRRLTSLIMATEQHAASLAKEVRG